MCHLAPSHRFFRYCFSRSSAIQDPITLDFPTQSSRYANEPFVAMQWRCDCGELLGGRFKSVAASLIRTMLPGLEGTATLRGSKTGARAAIGCFLGTRQS